MSEDHSGDVEETAPDEEVGVFYVSQINPIEAEEELKPQVKETAEGEEETAEDIEEETYTYQTGPTVTIKPKELNDTVQRILELSLKDKEYGASDMKKATLKISSALREAIKDLDLDRYRIISQVTVGEKCNQDVLMNFLYLWKHEFDHYIIAKYEEASFFAVALVFLVYKQ